MIRNDHADVVYKTEREKFDAVVEDIRERHEKRPADPGRHDLDREVRARLGDAQEGGIKHHVLNAKQHEREAEIVAQAGRFGAVTISTNMAGRGTDIVLGGNAEFMAANEAGTRDPDDPAFQAALEKYRAQVRGRARGGARGRRPPHPRHRAPREPAHRQPAARPLRPPGRSRRSRFFLSLEDDLLRIFGAERVQKIMERLGMEEGEPIEHRWINAAIENAQKKVEAHNFDIRKHLLEYDDVMNKQREVIYARRREVLSAESLKDDVLETAEELADGLVATQLAQGRVARRVGLEGARRRALPAVQPAPEPVRRGARRALAPRTRSSWSSTACARSTTRRSRPSPTPVLRHLEKVIMLQTIDTLWKDHLLAMDHLKEGIGLRGYGQKNPLQEYQSEGFDMFEDLMDRLDADIVEKLFTVQLAREEDVERLEQKQQQRQAKVTMTHGSEPAAAQPEAVKRDAPKVGRNDPCVCGSGKKYKKCCGAAH